MFGPTLLARHPGLVAGVTPLVLLDFLQLVVVKAHAFLNPLLHGPQKNTETRLVGGGGREEGHTEHNIVVVDRFQQGG